MTDQKTDCLQNATMHNSTRQPALYQDNSPGAVSVFLGAASLMTSLFLPVAGFVLAAGGLMLSRDVKSRYVGVGRALSIAGMIVSSIAFLITAFLLVVYWYNRHLG